MSRSIDAYREELEDMTAALLEEEYLHGAGRKPTLDQRQVYEEYADMASLSAARDLVADGAPRELCRFAAEAYLAGSVKELTDEIGTLESSLTVPLDGGEVPYLAVRPAILNEPDAVRRHTLWERRCEVTDAHLNPLYEALLERQRDRVADLGAATMLDLLRRFMPGDLDRLAKDARGFLSETGALYREAIDRTLREHVGITLERAGPQDLTRLWRAPQFDRLFPADRAVPALRATLAGLGIDLARQRDVELDLEARPGKQPRAFCTPIRVPGRVVLVVLPQGGQDDYRALFHEAGHTEHFAHASPALAAEDRVRGDNAVTEGWAFLFEHLVSDPIWLASRLDAPLSTDYVRFDALTKLYLVRRYAAKLAYELELHSGVPAAGLPDRYAEHLGEALMVPHPRSDFLADVDPWLYCTSYLRAWAFETQMADHLRSRYGADWFRQRRAGLLLRELWELGQSLDAEALLREVTGEALDFGVLAEDVHRRLSA